MRIEQTQEGFKFYYKRRLFLKHSAANPAIGVGIGKALYKMRHNRFKIREKELSDFPLKNYEIILQNEKEIIIEFRNKGQKLKIQIVPNKNNLEIVPIQFNSALNRFWIKIVATMDEAVYGCGEQFSVLNFKGYKVPLWVEDATPLMKDKFTTYFPLPSFIGIDKKHHQSYFIHLKTNSYSEFDFTNQNYHNLKTFEIPEKIVFNCYDSAMKGICGLSKYLGTQPKMPEWIFDGIILAVQGGNKIVEEKIEKALQNDIKVAGVWCQDWQGIRRTSFGQQLFWDWKYDDERYPNLPEFIKSLNEMDIKFLGYINSHLAVEGELYKEAKEKGYCVKNQNNVDYMIITTDFPSAVLDLSNPACLRWMKQVVKENMLGIGLDGWMVDYGEYSPVDAKLYSGVDAKIYHNQYPTFWSKLFYEILTEQNKQREILLFHRSNYINGAKYTMLQFSGDQRVDWNKEDGIPAVITAAINLGICGIGHYNFDIGGYTTFADFKRTKEIFMRSTEIATFSMVMRTHEGNRPKDNWQFDSDQDTLNHLSKMVKIHIELKPYLKYLEEQYQKKGIPPIGGLFMHYWDETSIFKIKHQYLLGKDLLIAPVIDPKTKKWNVYLPNDIWTHLWTGNEYNGGWIKVNAPIGEPPVFYRKKSDFSKLFNKLKNF